MIPAVLEEKVWRFQDMVGSSERVGVSEFARTKAWRDRLPAVGCFEVVDRNGVVGYLLAPEYATALSDKISELEEQTERAQIAAMFKARSKSENVLTGAELNSAALAYFDENAAALREIINGD